MIIVGTLVLLASIAPSATWYEEETISYEEIVHEALHNCKNSRGKEIDPDLLWRLVEIEKTYNPAPEVKGMVLAAACMESGFNPNAKGDRKFSKNGKKPMAIGILQQWKIYERLYGTDRLDPMSAAHGWMRHITKMIPRVKKQCRYKTPKRIWIAAWVTGVRSKKKGGRCRERPKHLRILKRWHRNIEAKRKFFKAEDENVGC